MVVRRLAAAALVLTLPATAVALSVPPEMAPSPQVLLAVNDEPVDDSDLATEESLTDLEGEEFQKRAWSMSAAVGLSFIPGGGFGLVYAEKKAASAVPFLLSVAGYAVGTLYLLGSFDTSKSSACYFFADPSAGGSGAKVKNFRCTYAKWTSSTNDDPIPGDVDNNPDLSQREPDGRLTTHSIDFEGTGKPYNKSASNYDVRTTGEDFDGQKTGVIILAATYAATSILGAVWSGLTIADYNEEIRKEIESTAMNRPKPIVGYDGENGFFGLAWEL
ncbi:MAG: hypothetical protein FJ253_11535 [Phycisphaerae bacterium]|nr:hypothetical protein [Phycisphaerae bacterium]